jgi:predicted DNA-binding transcriptional regulator AlpA
MSSTRSITIPETDLLSERDFARLFSRSLRTVRRWHVERRGPRRTVIGRSRYYSRRSIEAWLQRQTEDAAIS